MAYCGLGCSKIKQTNSAASARQLVKAKFTSHDSEQKNNFTSRPFPHAHCKRGYNEANWIRASFDSILTCLLTGLKQLWASAVSDMKTVTNNRNEGILSVNKMIPFDNEQQDALCSNHICIPLLQPWPEKEAPSRHYNESLEGPSSAGKRLRMVTNNDVSSDSEVDFSIQPQDGVNDS